VKARVKITYEVDVEVSEKDIDDYGDLYLDAEDRVIYEALDIIREGGERSREEQVFVGD